MQGGIHLQAIQTFDETVILFIQAHFHNPVTDAIFPLITALGNAGIFWILSAVLLLFFRKTRKWGLLLGIALAGTFVLNDLLIKPLAARPRPCDLFPAIELLIRRPASYSFPSGHSASSFSAAVVLFHGNRRLGILALLLAALIAFSRVFLFVHFPTDILTGALLGSSVALLLCGVLKKQKKLPAPFYQKS